MRSNDEAEGERRIMGSNRRLGLERFATMGVA
jgi:hypothetical protein